MAELNASEPARRRRPIRAALRFLTPGRAGWPSRLAYAVLSIPLGAAYLALFAGLLLAAVTTVLLIGLPLFLTVLALCRAFGGLERRLTRAMLRIEVDNGVRLRRRPGVLSRFRALLTSGSTWRTVAWLGARVLLGAGVLATVLVGIGVFGLLASYPEWLPLAPNPVADVVVGVMVVPLLAAVIRVVDLEVRVLASAAPALLGLSPAEQVEALRQESLRLAERNSVARDLHDTIGHSLTASLLQAGAARRTLTPDPDEPAAPVDPAFARQALLAIEDNTRAALAELDRALAVLGERRDASTTATRTLSAPDLRDVDQLVTGLRDGGLPLQVLITVPHDAVPPDVSRLAYRIIQEGTTNVLRHAGCVPTTVDVAGAGPNLIITVRNTTAVRVDSRPGPGGGRGIRGLQARATELGGRLTAGPVAGGFALHAVLPLGSADG